MLSHKLFDKLKKKLISKPVFKMEVVLNDTSVGVKISDKSDPNNTKRELAFKERIRQMNSNNLRAVKMKPKSTDSTSLTAPIRSFAKKTSETSDGFETKKTNKT